MGTQLSRAIKSNFLALCPSLVHSEMIPNTKNAIAWISYYQIQVIERFQPSKVLSCLLKCFWGTFRS